MTIQGLLTLLETRWNGHWPLRITLFMASPTKINEILFDQSTHFNIWKKFQKTIFFLAVTFGSGSGALCAIMHLLNVGDQVISMSCLYGGTLTYFNNLASQTGIQITYVDLMELGNLEKTLSPATKMVYLESPTNPGMKIVDISGIVKVVKAFRKDIVVVLDNSFTTPYFMRPLDLGTTDHRTALDFLLSHVSSIHCFPLPLRRGHFVAIYYEIYWRPRGYRHGISGSQLPATGRTPEVPAEQHGVGSFAL
jgi:hypothetical protein